MQLTREDKKNLLATWARIVKEKPDFTGCVNEIDCDCRSLLDMNLGSAAREAILNIAGNVITMNVIYLELCDLIKEVA